MNRFGIIDMHCDTVMGCCEDGLDLRSNTDHHISLEKLKKGNSFVQCFALYIRTHDMAEEIGWGDKTPYDIYRMMLASFKEEMARNSDMIVQVRSYDEIMKNADSGKLMAMLTVEDSEPVDGKIERFDEMYAEGVRMMSLTHNYDNCIGYANSRDPIVHNTKGLTPFGFEAVEKMNDLGILVDVSHLSERGFWDVIECAKKPFIASHSDARALCDHQRNLTDDQLRALAAKGGMTGINFSGGFIVKGNWRTCGIDDVLKHMVYIKNVAGIETLGWGSDYDGINAELEWKDASGFPILVDAMSKYFTDDEIELVCSKNFLRVLKDNE